MSTAPYQSHSATSYDAAREIENSVNRLQALVLAAITAAPGTDEELIERTGLTPNTFRPRRCELVSKGLVEDSGQVRLTRARRRAVVWRCRKP